ncbi:hypothetical protein DB345_15975 [Spartobacteria bacterium LR76]|nr:hypothetical protein DB345_15975 [Spartobacteria bacterium LR76]
MDRKAWIAVTISVLGLVGWYYYFGILNPPKPPVNPPVAEASPTASPGSATPAPTATPAAAEATSAPVIVARTESLSSLDSSYVFTNDIGGIRHAILNLHLGENDQPIALNGDSALPIGAIGDAPGKAWGGFDMTLDQANGVATFTRKDGDVQITKRFYLPADEGKKTNLYVVRLEVEFSNTGTSQAYRPPYFVSTGGAAPIHSTDLPTYTRFDWMHDWKFGGIDVNWFNAGSIPLIGIQTHAARDVYLESRNKVQWAAVASQYFCTIVSVPDFEAVSVGALRYSTQKANHTPVFGIEGALGMPGINLQPGQKVTKTFTIYAGPKELSRLKKLGEKQDAVLNFGWFGFISEILLAAMNWLHGVLFNSFAAAIIVLTLIIKSLLWPIQNKATNEMRKMSLLAPKMNELKAKYPDDPQKMNEEVMKLYREYGVNPFSGCFPMLIQIPIFFGFYAMLGSAIELRNSSFLWVHDLSQPDTVFHVLGFPINVLPIIMAGTMVWQMAITPKTGDAMQQRIFYFMPIIFLVFCYNYASGLALYWTTQNIFSIVQLYLTRNKPLPTLEKKSVIAKREAAATGKKKKKRPGQ